MSLFKKKAPKYTAPPLPPVPAEEVAPPSNGVDNNNGSQKSQLVFHCQQAHGSPLGLISGFSNVKELYQKIAECYDFPPEDVRNHFLSLIVMINNYLPRTCSSRSRAFGKLVFIFYSS